jgi:hypothetical protein
MRTGMNDEPEDEQPYVESEYPKPIAEMWKEYFDEFVNKLPAHEQFRVKHAFYHCAYALLIDVDKIPEDPPDLDDHEDGPMEKQLELWNEEVSAGLDDLASEYFKKHNGLPHDENIEGN